MDDDLKPLEAEHHTTKALQRPTSRGHDKEIAWEEAKASRALYAEPYFDQVERAREAHNRFESAESREEEGKEGPKISEGEM